MTRPPPTNERFLSRWSRLKRAQAESADVASAAPPVSSPIAAPLSTAGPAAHAAAVGASPVTRGEGEGAAPVLPSIESLTMESDYGQFFQPKVPESLRRAAVKKLFADPHFNVMDGLDTYIDDYTKSDPIPPEMLALMNHARDIIDHPSNRQPEQVVHAPVAQQDEQGPDEQSEGAAIAVPEVPAAAAPEHALGSAGQPAAMPPDEPDTPISPDATGAADLPARPPGTAA